MKTSSNKKKLNSANSEVMNSPFVNVYSHKMQNFHEIFNLLLTVNVSYLKHLLHNVYKVVALPGEINVALLLIVTIM